MGEVPGWVRDRFLHAAAYGRSLPSLEEPSVGRRVFRVLEGGGEVSPRGRVVLVVVADVGCAAG